MNLTRSIILVIFGTTLLLLAVRRLRRYRLKERYALLFLLLGLPFFVLAVWPSLIELWASRLQMNYGTLMLLCVSTFLFLIVFELLTIVSQQDQRISTLAQLVGILLEKQKDKDRQAADAQHEVEAHPPTGEESPHHPVLELPPLQSPVPLSKRAVTIKPPQPATHSSQR